MQDQKIFVICVASLIVNLCMFYYLIKLKHSISNNMGLNIEDIKASIDECIGNMRHTLDMSPSSTTKNTEKTTTEKQQSKYELNHLIQDTQYVYGPIQDDEAVFLYGLIKVIRPKTVIEFGFSGGYSSNNILKALDYDSKLYSYDITLYNANADAFKDPRFKFHLKSQTDFSPTDIDNRTIDLAYFDAGHTYDIEIPTFEKVIKHMSPVGIIAVHDTGLHYEDSFKIDVCTCDFSSLCGGAHQMAERVFINWILENHSEWQVVNLHSFNIYRHGLTILQRKYNLSTVPVDNRNCKYV